MNVLALGRQALGLFCGFVGRGGSCERIQATFCRLYTISLCRGLVRPIIAAGLLRAVCFRSIALFEANFTSQRWQGVGYD